MLCESASGKHREPAVLLRQTALYRIELRDACAAGMPITCSMVSINLCFAAATLWQA
jgi:hypothetical protein